MRCKNFALSTKPFQIEYSIVSLFLISINMRYFITQLFLLQLFLISGLYAQPAQNKADRCLPVDAEGFPGLFYYTDVCNVYILRDGNHALLIDLGNAGILDHLPDIGVEHIDWILFTHHHREQCQGFPKLNSLTPQIAAPKTERPFFEHPTSFRKTKTSLGDPYTIYGASYIRPPVEPIHIDREFAKMDTFTWRGYEIRCIETPGDSPGSMTYLINKNEKWYAFSGDVMLDGAKAHHFYDAQWDYGFGKGLRTLHNSAALIRDYHPAMLLPSHGPVIRQPEKQLNSYLKKLRETEQLLLRGYDVLTYSAADQDKLSKPTKIPFVWQVSPHLFKFKGPDMFVNFSLILSDSGHGLMVDCGLMDTTQLQYTLRAMQKFYGLKKIDALIITHMHGDHFLEAPFLKKLWGTPVWALENMAPMMEYPLNYDFSAMIPAYNHGFESIHVDRVFKPGETFKWAEHKFTIDWMPGQTKYALCMHGEIDDRKVAFTGDNIFADPDNTNQNGHEALVSRNDAILEEGYIYAAEYLKKLHPDILIGGHSFVMDHPAELIERYKNWSYKMRDAFRSLSPNSDYQYWFDPYWVHAEPYRIHIKQGQEGKFILSVRNFRIREQRHTIKIHTPKGVTVNPIILEDSLAPDNTDGWPVRLKIYNDCPTGVYIIAFDITLDDRAYGELFDAILIVE